MAILSNSCPTTPVRTHSQPSPPQRFSAPVIPFTNADIDGGYDPTDELLCRSCGELKVVRTSHYSVCGNCSTIQPGSNISDEPASFDSRPSAPDQPMRPSLGPQGQLFVEPVLSTRICSNTPLSKALARSQHRMREPRTKDTPANWICDETVAKRTQEGKSVIDDLCSKCNLPLAVTNCAIQHWLYLRGLEGNYPSKIHELDIIAAVCVFLAAFKQQCGVMLSQLVMYISAGEESGARSKRIREAMKKYHKLLKVPVPTFWDEVRMAIRRIFNQANNQVRARIDKRTGLSRRVSLSNHILSQALLVADAVEDKRGDKNLTCSKVQVAACACLLLAQEQDDYDPAFTAKELALITFARPEASTVICRKKTVFGTLISPPPPEECPRKKQKNNA